MADKGPPTPRLSQGVFLFTVDLELAWGMAHTRSFHVLEQLRADTSHARQALDALLESLERYEVPATWAVVGHLFLDRCQRVNGVCHADVARVSQGWYDVDPASDIGRAPLFYGRDIVDRIMSSRIQHEIGHHSFSHVPFDSCSAEVAEAEVAEGQRLARQMGITLRSFVFPRNKVGHVGVLEGHGFRIYRGRNLVHNVPGGRLGWALGGALDLAFAPPCQPRARGNIWEVPSSLYFSESRFPITLLPRAKLGVLRAARARRIFHVFLHDWNLVTDPGLGSKVDKLLAFVARHRERGNLETITMSDLAARLDGGS